MINVLKKYQADFHPVVHFDPELENLVVLNLTTSNVRLTEDLFNDVNTFSQYINDELNAANAKYGIGGYAEHRKLYSRSSVFDASNGEEARRLHLGVDIWGKSNTAVIAPFDGIIHSFAFNNQSGDYGATIILAHKVEEFSFYTLYGHLSLNSIKNLQEGQRIEKGDVFATFGIPIENGHWPPHLHFQIILDMGNWKGDYPGVCKFSEKETWLSNSPDPDIILQLQQYVRKSQ